MIECTTSINLELFDKFDPKKGLCKIKISSKEIYLLDPAGELNGSAYSIWLSKDRTRLAMVAEDGGFPVAAKGKNNATKFVSCPVVCRSIAASGIELPVTVEMSYDEQHKAWLAILQKGKAGKAQQGS
jgi:hypothetical protein